MRSNKLEPKAQELTVISNFGGLGDMINRLPALVYAHDKYPHVKINLVVYDYVYELFEEIAKQLMPRMKVIKISDKETTKALPKQIVIDFAPHVMTALKHHLTAVGFAYILDEFPDPQQGHWDIPQIKLDEVDVACYNVPERFGVLCTGYTAPVRAWSTHEVEEVAKWMIQQNITPVLLGSTNVPLGYEMGKQGVMLDAKALPAKFPPQVIDLREQTSLLQALKIMSKAKFVAGVDNGLLHLAHMSDVPTIWGFTTVDPIARVPYRHGKQFYRTLVVGQPDNLDCRYCQSKCFFFQKPEAPQTQDYKECMYDDYLCVSTLTAGKFIDKMKQVIGYKGFGVRTGQIELKKWY